MRRGYSRPKDGPKGTASRTPTTSFFGACEVSCRVRAERAKPYTSFRWRFTPGPARSFVGPPPPGAARRLGVMALLLLLRCIRPWPTLVNESDYRPIHPTS
jgi:hypothetical protein